MFRFVPRIAAVLLLVAACNFALAAPADERQVSGSGEGKVAYWNSALEGTCEVTHLGRSFVSVDYWTDFLGFGILFPFSGNLRSASGDELFFVFDKEWYDFDRVSGIVATTATITGGTGRFTSSTGSIAVTFDFDPAFSRFDFAIDGQVNY